MHFITCGAFWSTMNPHSHLRHRFPLTFSSASDAVSSPSSLYCSTFIFLLLNTLLSRTRASHSSGFWWETWGGAGRITGFDVPLQTFCFSCLFASECPAARWTWMFWVCVKLTDRSTQPDIGRMGFRHIDRLAGEAQKCSSHSEEINWPVSVRRTTVKAHLIS